MYRGQQNRRWSLDERRNEATWDDGSSWEDEFLSEEGDQEERTREGNNGAWMVEGMRERQEEMVTCSRWVQYSVDRGEAGRSIVEGVQLVEGEGAALTGREHGGGAAMVGCSLGEGTIVIRCGRGRYSVDRGRGPRSVDGGMDDGCSTKEGDQGALAGRGKRTMVARWG